jgi:serine/threonine protein kinase/class 3 adenylate cyclase
MDEKTLRGEAGGAAAAVGTDHDIDNLLQARGQVDSALRRHRAKLAILFTDIVGSTSFFERYGDTAGLIMLHRHDMLVMPAVEEAGGTVIKTIGDAVLATFPEAKQAVEAGIKIQQKLDEYNQHQAEEDRIFVRVGINFGSGFVKDKDVFGDVVNVAARFVKNCAPAQILVSRSVYEAVKQETTTTIRQLGSASFHGKSAREDVYEVLWTSADVYDRLRAELEVAEGIPSGRSALGRYELLEELGRGAMGVVHKAYDPTVGRVVALKTVRLDVAEQDRAELIQRLRREAQAAGRLEHPNIVTIYDAGESEGLFYLAMQFVKGKTMAEIIAERKLLPIEELLPLIQQLCEGLECAHQSGIVHRDLKPTNIIVTPEGVPKIVDFGVAKIAETGSTKAGMVVGTPSYMSPEQAQGGRVDRRSDIFSLGTILYELLAGEKPFPGNTPTAIIYKILHENPIPLRAVERSVPPALERVVHKALAKSPYERYQSCRELLGELHAAVQPGASPAAMAKGGRLQGVAGASFPHPVQTPSAHLGGQSWAGVLLGFLVLVAIGVTAVRAGWLPALDRLLSPPESQQTSQPAESSVASPPVIPPPTEAASSPTQASPAPVEPGRSDTRGEGSSSAAAMTPVTAPVTQKAPESQAPVERRETGTPAATAGNTGPTAAQPARQTTSSPRPRTLTARQQRELTSWLRQAEQYVSRGQYREAYFALNKALEIDPNHRKAREALQRVREELARRRSTGQDQ